MTEHEDEHEDEREEAYALHGDEIETRHDAYVHRLKEAVKLLKQRGSAAGERMRPMDSDNPLDSPDRWDI